MTIKGITAAFVKNGLAKIRLKAIGTTATRAAVTELAVMVNSCKSFSVSQQREINRSFKEVIVKKMGDGYQSARETEVSNSLHKLFECIKDTLNG